MKKPTPLTALLGGAGRLAFLTAAGWLAYSHFLMDHQLPLPKAIPADQFTLAFPPTGPLNVYVDRGGPDPVSTRPLVLIHSINAAASSYEMRPLFQHYRGQRPVYALDLPGFGFSARPRADYTTNTYVEAILALLAQVEGGPADVITLSLGGEFGAEAARRRPDLFRSLALLSPSGFGLRNGKTSNLEPAAWVLPTVSFPLWARPLFDLLTTKRSIDFFLGRSFVGAPAQELLDYAHTTARQPGAEHAPLAFISGRLFSRNAVDLIYRHVTVPSLIIYDQDAFVGFARLPELLAANPAWRATRVTPTMGLPQWEELEATARALDAFWQSLEAAP
jgi:pimeloyl-ACP methyl ester carboxylesterase